MIKSYFLLLLLFICSLLFSQSQPNVPLYGFVGGFNKSGIDAAHNPSAKKNSFYLGALVRIPLNQGEKLYLQPQIEYFEAGEIGPKNSYNPQKSIYANNYLNIPIYLKYYFNDNDETFFVFGGPKFAYLINQKIKNPSQERYEEDKQGKANPFDFSISGGLGYKFLRYFEVVSRLDYGLTDTYPKIDDSYFDPKAKRVNNQVSGSIGISYLIPNHSCACSH